MRTELAGCPFCVLPVDVIEYEDVTGVVTPCCSARNGFDVARLKRMSHYSLAESAFRIFTFLAVLHSRGWVHCDMKTEHLCLSATEFLCEIENGQLVSRTEFPWPLIGDFDMARKVDENGEVFAGGTWRYNAPERLSGGRFGPRVDEWGAGCTLLELATARHAFDNPGDIAQGRHNPVTGLHREPDFVNFIDRLLVVDPAYRLTAAEALNHPFITRRNECRERTEAAVRVLRDAPNFDTHAP
jgi:serine/threonine protein kinase